MLRPYIEIFLKSNMCYCATTPVSDIGCSEISLTPIYPLIVG